MQIALARFPRPWDPGLLCSQVFLETPVGQCWLERRRGPRRQEAASAFNRALLPPATRDTWPCLEMSVIVSAVGGVLLACGRWRPGMLVHSPQCPGRPVLGSPSPNVSRAEAETPRNLCHMFQVAGGWGFGFRSLPPGRTLISRALELLAPGRPKCGPDGKWVQEGAESRTPRSMPASAQ